MTTPFTTCEWVNSVIPHQYNENSRSKSHPVFLYSFFFIFTLAFGVGKVIHFTFIRKILYKVFAWFIVDFAKSYNSVDK